MTHELAAMLVSFVAVILIAAQKPVTGYETDKALGTTYAVTNVVMMSSVAVATRKMQGVHHSVVLLSYGVFSAVVLAAGLLIEALIVG